MKNGEFRNEYMTFFTPDALVTSVSIFRDESFFFLNTAKIPESIFGAPWLFLDFHVFPEYRDSCGKMKIQKKRKAPKLDSGIVAQFKKNVRVEHSMSREPARESGVKEVMYSWRSLL